MQVSIGRVISANTLWPSMCSCRTSLSSLKCIESRLYKQKSRERIHRNLVDLFRSIDGCLDHERWPMPSCRSTLCPTGKREPTQPAATRSISVVRECQLPLHPSASVFQVFREGKSPFLSPPTQRGLSIRLVQATEGENNGFRAQP